MAVPEWIEKASESEVKAKRQLPEIPVTWESTTIPELPESIISLPIGANLRVTTEAIHIHAERVHSYPDDEGVEEANLLFRKQDIVGVDIVFMPEIADGTDMQYISVSDFSRAILRHRDPFEVVPFFENTFTAGNPYWLKALAKAVQEILGVEPSVTQIDSKP
jgi:hypothetical protein